MQKPAVMVPVQRERGEGGRGKGKGRRKERGGEIGGVLGLRIWPLMESKHDHLFS